MSYQERIDYSWLHILTEDDMMVLRDCLISGSELQYIGRCMRCEEITDIEHSVFCDACLHYSHLFNNIPFSILQHISKSKLQTRLVEP